MKIEKIDEIIEASCAETTFDKLVYALTEIVRCQDDGIEFLRDALTMVEDEAVDLCYASMVDSALIVPEEDDEEEPEDEAYNRASSNAGVLI